LIEPTSAANTSVAGMATMEHLAPEHRIEALEMLSAWSDETVVDRFHGRYVGLPGRPEALKLPWVRKILRSGIGEAPPDVEVAWIRFVAAADIKTTLVPFKGTPEVIAAILSKSVDCYWAPISAALANIKAGKLHALAVSTPARNPTLPDVPTTGEAGVANADSPWWFGLWAPAGTPAPVVAKISADVRKALADPEVKKKLQNLGNDTMDMSQEQFAAYVRQEIDNSGKLLRAEQGVTTIWCRHDPPRAARRPPPNAHGFLSGET